MRILVLVLERDPGFGAVNPSYLLEYLMREWKTMGVDVQIVRGTKDFVPADVLIPHVDLTKVPDEYRAFMRRYRTVVNESVLDTSKSRISAHILKRRDSYSGPVIVKTECNYGGLPEAGRRGSSKTHYRAPSAVIDSVMAKIARKVTGSTPWRYVSHLPPGQYPVFQSIHEVPGGVFKNDKLLVEKYLPEVEGSDYLLRYYYFLGDREMSLLLKSKYPVVKFSNAYHISETPVHPGLRAIRSKMGFGYGKFDYFLNDGKLVLFDVNKTPGHTAGHAGGRYEELYHRMVHHLAGGVRSFMRESPDGGAGER